MKILKSNCCNAGIKEVVSGAIVTYDIEIAETGAISHSMVPEIETL